MVGPFGWALLVSEKVAVGGDEVFPLVSGVDALAALAAPHLATTVTDTRTGLTTKHEEGVELDGSGLRPRESTPRDARLGFVI